MKRILFVYENPSILDGPGRMLRPQRKEWDMVFAASGRGVLEVADTSSVDVTITDM